MTTTEMVNPSTAVDTVEGDRSIWLRLTAEDKADYLENFDLESWIQRAVAPGPDGPSLLDTAVLSACGVDFAAGRAAWAFLLADRIGRDRQLVATVVEGLADAGRLVKFERRGYAQEQQFEYMPPSRPQDRDENPFDDENDCETK